MLTLNSCLKVEPFISTLVKKNCFKLKKYLGGGTKPFNSTESPHDMLKLTDDCRIDQKPQRFAFIGYQHAESVTLFLQIIGWLKNTRTKIPLCAHVKVLWSCIAQPGWDGLSCPLAYHRLTWLRCRQWPTFERHVFAVAASQQSKYDGCTFVCRLVLSHPVQQV